MGKKSQWSNKNGIMSRRYKAQRGRCYLCSGRMAIGISRSNTPNIASRDHVFPKAVRSHTKYDHTRNILLAHRNCNNKKGSREPYPCEVLFLEITNTILYGYEKQDDPTYDMSGDWIPIDKNAKKNGQAPYDKRQYDVWFKGKFWIGYRESEIEWDGSFWCDRYRRELDIAPYMMETHYMLPPTSPIYAKEK